MPDAKTQGCESAGLGRGMRQGGRQKGAMRRSVLRRRGVLETERRKHFKWDGVGTLDGVGTRLNPCSERRPLGLARGNHWWTWTRAFTTRGWGMLKGNRRGVLLAIPTFPTGNIRNDQ